VRQCSPSGLVDIQIQRLKVRPRTGGSLGQQADIDQPVAGEEPPDMDQLVAERQVQAG
jgi:hypothetical protein